VQVGGRTVQRDLRLGETPHAGAQGRHVGGPHGRVADHDGVAGQPVAAVAQELGEVRRAGLLLALDQHLDRHRGRGGAARGQVRLQPERVEEHLSLVVGRAAADDLVAALDRFERVGLPLSERFDRLHVVVAVDDHGRRGGIGRGPLGEHGRQAGGVLGAGLPDLHDGEPGLAQMRSQPFRGTPHVTAARGVTGDRRDREPLLQRAEKAARVGLDVFAYVH
jgi:hypothetical protein